MRRLLLLVAILPYANAQTKHPFTFEDMMALKRVEEPQPSPDGKWVLFAAVDVDLKANTKTPYVWVVPLSPTSESARVGDRSSDKAGSSSHSLVGMTGEKVSGITGQREREVISDQDADRPRWAPDGKRFAFVSSKGNGSQIWIADFDGTTGTVTGKHRLTNIPTEADGELWSPDGKNILFKSDVYPECDGEPEAEYGCNAKKVDEAKSSKVKAQIFTHLLYRHWNAYKEGKKTHLFVVPVDRATSNHVGADASSAQSSEARQELSKVKDPTLPQNTREGWGNPISVARDLTPGDYDAPVFSLGGQDDYSFSPDGQEICYASNHDPEPAISTNNDLFTVPVNVRADALRQAQGRLSSAQVLAATKNITAENKAADNTPLYSPDGKYIAYRAQQHPGNESDRWRLKLYDRKTGQSTNRTEDFDRWVGSIAWATDSTTIYFTAENSGNSPIYHTFIKKIPGVQDWPSEVVSGYNDDLTPVKGTNAVLFTRMSLGSPNEIYSAIVGQKHLCIEDRFGQRGSPAWYEGSRCLYQDMRLTHINDSLLSQVPMSPLVPFWFTGANNDKVEGFLVKPPNFDPSKKYPVKFIVHGGPEVPMGDEWSYRWNDQLFAASGYVVIFINFHGSPGYGQKFIDAINGDWGGAPFEDLMKGLDYAEQHYAFIDKERECALGASYGGYMVNWILGHTNRFKCIVSHDGMFNTESAWGTTEELWFNEWEFKGTPYTNREMYQKWSPHLSATNLKTPTLVVHGQLDYRLDVSQGFDLFTTLQRQGVPSKMLYFPDEGHWVLKPQNSQLWYKTVNDWVDQWTKPVAGGQ
jgi:dipeptidyl aminopeptidase/acylaminoacyl peptidase